MIYWSVLIILAILAFAEVLVIKKGNKTPHRDRYLFFIVAVMMTLISALRFETGRDWGNYISYFDTCRGEVNSVFEPGYFLLNKLFRSITDNYYIMQAVCSIFSCSIIYWSIVKKSLYPLYTLFIYYSMFYLTMEMAVVRQSIAMAIICLGIPLIYRRQLLPWILIILLAMQFHITSIAAFPLYYTMNKTITRKLALSFVVLALVITIFGKNITDNIIYFIGGLPFIPERLQAVADIYLQSVDGNQQQFDSGLGYVATQFFNFIIVFAYGTRNKNGSYYMLNFCIALILLSFGRNFDVLGRLANYYLVCGSGICAYNLLIDSKWYLKANSRVVAAGVCTIFILFRIYTFYSQWISPDVIRDYTPYKVSIFQ